MEPEPEERPSIEYMDIVLDENFEEWLIKKADPIKYKGLMKTLYHLRENGLKAILETLKINRSSIGFEYLYFKIEIKGKGTEEGISFEFDGRSSTGHWEFGILIDDIKITSETGKILELKGQGYARFMMAIMVYCLEEKSMKPELKTPEGGQLLIGIDADASLGFWGAIGAIKGRYSRDQRGNYSKVTSFAGYEMEIVWEKWKDWIFSDSKKRARSKKKKSKKIKKKTKRKIKRRSKKSKMR